MNAGISAELLAVFVLSRSSPMSELLPAVDEVEPLLTKNRATETLEFVAAGLNEMNWRTEPLVVAVKTVRTVPVPSIAVFAVL
jgi:hypothetical protein